MADKMTIPVCASCDPLTPIIFTLAFRSAECWCPRCGNTFGAFEPRSKKVETNMDLENLHKDLHSASANYLQARGIVYCQGRTKIGGVLIGMEDLMGDKRVEMRNIAMAGFDIISFDAMREARDSNEKS